MSYMLAVVVLLIAAGLRITQLTTLPPGMSDAEIIDARLALTVKQVSQFGVFYEYQGEGREGLYHTILAFSTSLTGEGIFGYRLVSVAVGMLALAFVYALGRHIYDPMAGLGAMALMAVNFVVILGAREISRATFIPLIISTLLLALSWAFPVYRRARVGSANTTTFATLGFVLGISLYLHQVSVLLVLASMLFYVYMILSRQRLSRRRISYIGFAILVTVIIALPYLLATIRRPDLAASQRLDLFYDVSLIETVIRGLTSLFVNGDTNPLQNIPLRPLFDSLSAFVILVGIVTSIRYWWQPRFMLLLITTVILSPIALLSVGSPNFEMIRILIPLFALYFGLGASVILNQLRPSIKRIAYVGLLGWFAFNLIWVSHDLFNQWGKQAEVVRAYNGDVARIAHHIDLTSGHIPTVICNPLWDVEVPAPIFTRTQLIRLMMNRQSAKLREIDCNESLLFTDGGELAQIVLIQPDALATMPLYLNEWVTRGESVPTLPPNTVIQLNIGQELADKAGLFTTLSPAGYLIDDLTIDPPIRLGGNITFLGDERDPDRIYAPGDVVEVITYWRVEGEVPRDLTLFTHVLSDPVTLVANRDGISVNPRQIEDRDVFIQIIGVELPEQMLDGQYFISIGAYTAENDNRLPVFDATNQPQGDRLFLYPITVVAPVPDPSDETADE